MSAKSFETGCSWKPHEVEIINEMCDVASLVASLFDIDIQEPVAAFTPTGRFKAILSVLSVTRCGEIYRLLDSNCDLVKEGESLPDVLIDVKNAGAVAKALAILPCGTYFLGR